MSILCYHAVQTAWRSQLAVTPADFVEQCAWLVKHRTVLPLEHAVRRLDRSGRLPRGSISLTFDDGFRSVYEHAFETLTRYDLPATVFLVAETLTPTGRQVDWVDTPPPYPLTTLTRDHVIDMRDAGITFGSHSYSHHDLTTLGYEACVEDLRRSRELLEDLLERPVPLLAYPRGRHDADVRKAAEQAGYSHSFTLPEKPEAPGPHAIPRVGVYPGNGPCALRIKTQRSYLPLRTGPAFPLLRRVAGRWAPVARRQG